MRRAVLVLALCLSVLATPEARGHALEPAYLQIAALGDARWRVTWRRPDVAGRPMAIDAVLPAACAPQRGPAPRFDGRAWASGWIAECSGGIGGGAVFIEGLDRTRTDALVRYELTPRRAETRRLTAAEPAFELPAVPSALRVFGSYAALGVSHILEGIDHLLFVFALMLLVRGRRRLVTAITAFTIGHSVSLAASTFGWITVAPPPVEAAIALSIMFLAAEIVSRAPERSGGFNQAPWLAAGGFGLLHGLGFAGALQEIGLPGGDVPLALLAFNIGVEIGQLLFIALLLVSWALLGRLYPATLRWTDHPRGPVRLATAHVMGALAAFWVIQRVAAF